MKSCRFIEDLKATAGMLSYLLEDAELYWARTNVDQKLKEARRLIRAALEEIRAEYEE